MKANEYEREQYQVALNVIHAKLYELEMRNRDSAMLAREKDRLNPAFASYYEEAIKRRPFGDLSEENRHTLTKEFRHTLTKLDAIHLEGKPVLETIYQVLQEKQRDLKQKNRDIREAQFHIFRELGNLARDLNEACVHAQRVARWLDAETTKEPWRCTIALREIDRTLKALKVDQTDVLPDPNRVRDHSESQATSQSVRRSRYPTYPTDSLTFHDYDYSHLGPEEKEWLIEKLEKLQEYCLEYVDSLEADDISWLEEKQLMTVKNVLASELSYFDCRYELRGDPYLSEEVARPAAAYRRFTDSVQTELVRLRDRLERVEALTVVEEQTRTVSQAQRPKL